MLVEVSTGYGKIVLIFTLIRVIDDRYPFWKNLSSQRSSSLKPISTLS